MDWIVVIQQYINIKAVVVAIVLTQLIKFFLPPVPKDILTWWDRFTVRSGPVLNRIVPVLPVAIAFVVTYFLERDSTYTMEDAVHGISSGAFAGYTYRTTKTMIFGE
jgi:hypothetical protein